jgi:hypothetical protein
MWLLAVLTVSIVTISAIYFTGYHEPPLRQIAPAAAFYPAEVETNGTVRFTISAISTTVPDTDLAVILQLDGGGFGSRAELSGGIHHNILTGSGEQYRMEVVDHNGNGNLDAGDGVIISNDGDRLPSGTYQIGLIHESSGTLLCESTIKVP